MTDKQVAVLGIYTNRIQTEGVVNALMQAGFSGADISLLMPEPEDDAPMTVVPQRHPRSTGGSSAVAGGGIGLLAGLGSLDVRGVGSIIAAGPIVATLAGAGAGADGWLRGALVGMGVPEDDARRYESRVRRGAILLCAHGESVEQARRANAVLEQTGAEDLLTSAEAPEGQPAMLAGPDPA